MDHDLELFIPILEILEIEVCDILYNGNIGKLIFSLSPILEIVDRTIHTQPSKAELFTWRRAQS